MADCGEDAGCRPGVDGGYICICVKYFIRELINMSCPRLDVPGSFHPFSYLLPASMAHQLKMIF